MANKSTYNNYRRDTPISESNYDRQISSRNSFNSDSTGINRLTSQRQLSDSRTPTTCFILFENALSINSNKIYFLEYRGTRARNHHHVHKLYLPQVVKNGRTSTDETYNEFADCIKQVLNTIPYDDLSSYVVSVRTGVLYYFSKSFRFNQQYLIEEIHNIIEKKIPTSDERYYYHPRMNNSNQLDESLRSSFSNVKPISQIQKFAGRLRDNHFYVKQPKYFFRIYLQSDNKQTHVCTVDPALNYSIIEFSKDFQRTSNIDFIRDRSSSKFQRNRTYDDIFDFRIQFQYNPRTCSDQMTTIEYELHQQFPSLDPNFKNENILIPFSNNKNDYQEFYVCEQLCPYVRFIRRDFGDVYQYNGDDELFENFNIYLESSAEYDIDYRQSTCKCTLTTYGLVYARLDLNTMISSNKINEDLLIEKLWDMGNGLTSIAGECTTSETQQSTNYYTPDGNKYTAEDEALIQTILKQPTFPSMIGLTNYASNDDIKQSFDRINDQLHTKWNCIRGGIKAHEKLHAFYEKYINEQN